MRGHCGAVATHSPPTSEVVGSIPGPYVENMVVLTDGQQFTVENFDQLYVLDSSVQIQINLETPTLNCLKKCYLIFFVSTYDIQLSFYQKIGNIHFFSFQIPSNNVMRT